MNMSRVLGLVQFDFSYSSAIFTLNSRLIFGLSASKSNPIKAICDLWNQGSSYLKLGKTNFSLYLCTGSYFHFWNHIIINTCYSTHHFCFYDLFLTKHWSIAHSFSFCFSYTFYQSLKMLHMHFINKNVPAKRDPGFMKVGSLFAGRIYCHINRFWFFNRIPL